MDDVRRTKISRYLSRALRHRPDSLGLALAPGGWVPVDALLIACAEHHFFITREELNEVVARNDKQRFAFDESGIRIRANQGHSVAVDLQLEPQTPPDVLFHGTGQKSVEFIRHDGLRKMSRQHVHLSANVETAFKVGARQGSPVVLCVDASRMYIDGHKFYRSANGVWLVEYVPPEYLVEMDEEN